MAPHLLASISFHGFGHIGQSAPVINALMRRIPELRVTVQCAAPLAVLRSHLHCDFTHLPERMDWGVVNRGALTVLSEATARVYRDFHTGWEQKVEHAAAQLRMLQPDVILADVPYLTLAAAAQAQIPALALCSLNWADIYAHYCGARAEAAEILAQMHTGYRSAQVFLQPEPSMPMNTLTNTRRIGPIARVGRLTSKQLRQTLGIQPNEKIVLVSLGGIHTEINVDSWPRLDGVRWLVQAEKNIRHPDAVAWDSSNLSYIDVLHAADALLTKPGYGSFAEAACNGVPTLYVLHRDWPEQMYLVDWLPKQVPCVGITQAQFARGDFAGNLFELLATRRPEPVHPTGIEQAADIVAEYLRRQ